VICQEIEVEYCEPRIHEFQDYRDYLLEYYRWRKQVNWRFSYRFFAARLGMDVSQVHRILHRRIHMPLKSVPKFVRVLGIERERARDFEGRVKNALAKGSRPPQTMTMEH
jgi:uncharacterized protein (TIGR02147 family)